MRKKVLSWLSTFLILMGSLLPAVVAVAGPEAPLAAGTWVLSSRGPTYASGNTTWEYSFARKGREQVAVLELSLCSSFNAGNVSASHGGVVSGGGAGAPSVIRWVHLQGTETLSVTYTGLWANGSQSWSLQTLTTSDGGTVSGPACEPLVPDFTLTKTVNTINDRDSAQDSLTLTGGGTVYFFYTITNTGNSAISIESFTDDLAADLPAAPGEIAAGGRVLLQATSTPFPELQPGDPPQTYSGTVSATGTFGGTLVTRATTATIINRAEPAAVVRFTLEKTVSKSADPSTGQDSVTIKVGENVWYFYKVTNNGDTDITVRSVIDNLLGEISFPADPIQPRHSRTAIYGPVTFRDGQPYATVNEAVVTVDQATTTVRDTATVYMENPKFSISNKVSKQNDPATAGEQIVLTGGGTAYYFYTITNTGNVELTIDSSSHQAPGALNWDRTTLGAGEIARAEATQDFAPLPPGSDPVNAVNNLSVTMKYLRETLSSQSDPSAVVNEPVPAPRTGSFAASLQVNDQPGTPGGSNLLLPPTGGTVYFTVTITNTGGSGDPSLHIDQINLNIPGVVLTPDKANLAPGEHTVARGQHHYPGLPPGSSDQVESIVATVGVTFDTGTSDTEEARATVTRAGNPAGPSFTLAKKVAATNDPSRGAASLTLQNGGRAYYFFTFTNTGNVPLTISRAVDTHLGNLSFSPAVVPVGGTATATATKLFAAPVNGTQTETNTATVEATYLRQTYQQTATATVVNVPRKPPPPPPPTPTSFTVAKRVSKENDPSTAQPIITLTRGSTVYYFYTVTNTGETVITIDSAIDDKLGNLSFSPATIHPGQSSTAMAEKIFNALPPGSPAQSETNTVSVSVINSNGARYGPLTAAATVVNQAPQVKAEFTVTKSVSTSQRPELAQHSITLPAEGGTVYYFYTVANTGNVPITIVSATDDKLGPISFTPSVIPQGAKATAAAMKTFGPGHAGQTVSNKVSVLATYDGVTYGPVEASASVQVTPQAEGTLEVRVMDGSESPLFSELKGATVTLSNGRTGTTDANGRVLFTKLGYGEYGVTASAVDPRRPTPDTRKEKTGSVTLGAKTPDEIVTFVFVWPIPGSSPSIAVTVCPAFTQVGGAVTATGPDGATATGVLQADGTYQLEDLRAGTWQVSLSAPGLPEGSSRSITLRDDHAVRNNAYSLDLSALCPPTTATIYGEVCAPHEAGAKLLAQGPNGATAEVSFPYNGRLGEWRGYLLPNLVPGEWKLFLHEWDGKVLTQTVNLHAGDKKKAENFTLACTGQPGAPLPGIGHYMAALLLIGAGLILRRWARA